MSQDQKTTYQTIKAIVLKRIHDNTWPPGALLPGEVELAEEFQCARATVNRAMRELADDGIIDRKRKSGTRVKSAPTRQARFVIPIIRTEIEETGATYRYALIERTLQRAPAWLRGQLGLSPDAQVLHLQCVHYADGKPFQFENRWIHLAPVPQARQADFDKTGPNEWLIDQVPFTDAEVTFSAALAAAEVAALMSIPEGTALFTSERTTWLANEPVTFAQFHFHSGYRMTTRL